MSETRTAHYVDTPADCHRQQLTGPTSFLYEDSVSLRILFFDAANAYSHHTVILDELFLCALMCDELRSDPFVVKLTVNSSSKLPIDDCSAAVTIGRTMRLVHLSVRLFVCQYHTDS